VHEVVQRDSASKTQRYKNHSSPHPTKGLLRTVSYEREKLSEPSDLHSNTARVVEGSRFVVRSSSCRSVGLTGIPGPDSGWLRHAVPVGRLKLEACAGDSRGERYLFGPNLYAVKVELSSRLRLAYGTVGYLIILERNQPSPKAALLRKSNDAVPTRLVLGAWCTGT
jgi:hypothetical protein